MAGEDTTTAGTAPAASAIGSADTAGQVLDGAGQAADAAAQAADAVQQAPHEIALGLVDRAVYFVEGLMRTWNAYQVAIALGIFVVAHLAARWAAPRLEAWLRTREGWPMLRMRFAVLVQRRMRLFIFVLLIWPVVWIMRDITWPSRSYLLGVVGQLAFAWLVIAIGTRLILNGFLRSTVRMVGWVWVTVSILGLSEDAVNLMDSIAVNLGDIRLSLWLVVRAVAILGVLLFSVRFVAAGTAKSIKQNEEISPSMQVLLVKLLQVGLYTAAFLLGLKTVGVDLTAFAVLSGAIGVGLGFGLQKVVSNLVSGIIILLDKSIKPGDVISLGETFGWIQQLGARYVSVVTRDGKEYLIPNEDLITGQVVNWSYTDPYVRLDIAFGTAYHNDPHMVRKVAIQAALSVDRVLRSRPPVCHIVGFGDSSVDYLLRFWIDDPTGGLTNIRGNVFLALWDAFQANGVDIPYPQREVRMLDDTPS